MITSTDISPAAPPGIAPAADAGLRHADQRDHSLFGDDGLTFRDLLDMINPLQHLPVVSTIYRSLVDDELSPGSRMVGGGLFGGFIGLGVAMFNSVLEDLTGKDLGEHVLAMFTGPDEPDSQADVMLAAATAKPEATDPPAPAPPAIVAALIGSSPAAAPMPAPPRPIIPVHREELSPPPPPSPPHPPTRSAALKEGAAIKEDASAAAISATLAAHRAAHAEYMRTAGRDRAPAYSLNTDLINLLMFSVPVRVGEGARESSDGFGSKRPGDDRTSMLDGGQKATQVAANHAYQRGLAAHTAAVSGAPFTPIAATGNL
ncbi:MAG: hypothetical protein HQ511_11560 [Rhodospirillales bacterium]|nr:hypothetical protein [Rhodospirillales bacterium]